MAVGENVSAPSVRAGDRAALQAVNLFMADMQAGIGPFLGVLLLGRGWATGAIGAVTTVGGILKRYAERDVRMSSTTISKLDQLHIHVGLVPSPRHARGRCAEGPDGRMGADRPGCPHTTFWAYRIAGTELANVNPFRLAAEELGGKTKGRGDLDRRGRRGSRRRRRSIPDPRVLRQGAARVVAGWRGQPAGRLPLSRGRARRPFIWARRRLRNYRLDELTRADREERARADVQGPERHELHWNHRGFIAQRPGWRPLAGQIPTPASDGAGYRLRDAADAVSSLSHLVPP